MGLPKPAITITSLQKWRHPISKLTKKPPGLQLASSKNSWASHTRNTEATLLFLNFLANLVLTL
jgi:hypothetical protein